MTMISPISQALASLCATGPGPISSASVIAPMQTGTARLAVSWSANDDCFGMWSPTDEPGVAFTAWSRAPDTIVPLPPLTAPEQSILQSAWVWGAWDIVRTTIRPGFEGALPTAWEPFAPELRAQGYVVWTWRPMLGGPEIRAKVNCSAKRDVTLDPISLSRPDDMPVINPPPIRPGTQHVIQMGRTEQEIARGRVPMASPRQMSYIRHLRSEAGHDNPDDLPRMTIREASAWIERLTGKRAARRDPPATGNQIAAIQHYMQRAGLTKIEHPDAPSPHPALWVTRSVTYKEAQKWLAWARDQAAGGRQ